jgi:hypothetical protein
MKTLVSVKIYHNFMSTCVALFILVNRKQMHGNVDEYFQVLISLYKLIKVHMDSMLYYVYQLWFSLLATFP